MRARRLLERITIDDNWLEETWINVNLGLSEGNPSVLNLEKKFKSLEDFNFFSLYYGNTLNSSALCLHFCTQFSVRVFISDCNRYQKFYDITIVFHISLVHKIFHEKHVIHGLDQVLKAVILRFLNDRCFHQP